MSKPIQYYLIIITVLKPSSEPSNNHSLGSPKEQLNDEKKLCADTITMEADYLTINSKVQSEISDFHRQGLN